MYEKVKPESNKKILLIEDESSIRELLKLNLQAENYVVEEFSDAKLIYQQPDRVMNYDLAILDIMMPEINGIELCQKIRLENNITPILFLTAKSTRKDVVEGLSVGADDYLVKPFDLEEFLLRVKNLIKKGEALKLAHVGMLEYILIGNNKIYPSKYEAINFNHEKISLTKKEIHLLQLLYRYKNQVVAREHMLREITDFEGSPSPRSIDNMLVNFRKYFEHDSKNPEYFLSIRGVGYKLEL